MYARDITQTMTNAGSSVINRQGVVGSGSFPLFFFMGDSRARCSPSDRIKKT